ncbi:thioredoxin domain-containing protein [Candidatus Saccharibacteria bacterium]|nr:thioredoxin domain-containing protein [Candidatus Saccharibacteria bacterium]MBQ3445332.1 thioredoxin domain-containing protein [Candidatus Saccharibacteria bacterium]
MKSVNWRLMVGVAIVATILLICASSIFGSSGETADYIYEASEATGMIGEKVIGEPETAEMIVYEYADFGCSHCAEWNQKLNEIVEKTEGKIAVVFRYYNIGLFKNSATAARAATAAQMQGYFGEYKDLLFSNQAEWLYADGEELEGLLAEYFEIASAGAGDAVRFKSDMESEAVKKRLRFEQNMGKKVGLSGTPLFRINGENVSAGKLAEKMEEWLGVQDMI